MAGSTLYAARGARLTQYALDVEGARLTELGSLDLPVGVQYAWRHHAAPYLYVGCSDGGLGAQGTRHCLATLRIAPDGALSLVGEPIPLRWRPVHVTLDGDSRHVFVTFNDPSGFSVFRIEPNGSVGPEVPQPPWPEMHTTAHQMRITPDNKRAIVPVRGNDAVGETAEDPGSLEVFDHADGVLTHAQSVAPNKGLGFGPRHVDFHPVQPWMYLSIERQQQIAFFRLGAKVDGPHHRKTTLERPAEQKPRQIVGAIHVHPNGRFAYVSNRADGTVDHGGQPVFNGAENSIAVFALDPATGEPTRIQNEDTRGMHARTFHIDPSGRLMVVANMRTRNVLDTSGVREVPGGLSVFRIGDDGRLAFQYKHDIDTRNANLFWTAIFALPEK